MKTNIGATSAEPMAIPYPKTTGMLRHSSARAARERRELRRQEKREREAEFESPHGNTDDGESCASTHSQIFVPSPSLERDLLAAAQEKDDAAAQDEQTGQEAEQPEAEEPDESVELLAGQ